MPSLVRGFWPVRPAARTQASRQRELAVLHVWPLAALGAKSLPGRAVFSVTSTGAPRPPPSPFLFLQTWTRRVSCFLAL
jgi:hypothetical protein